MKFDAARYRKAIVAALGVVAIFAPEVAGLEGDVASIYDGVIGLLIAFGVYRVPNAPAALDPNRIDNSDMT